MQRVGALLVTLAMMTGIAVSSALSATHSALNIPALKLKGNVTRGRRVFISIASCGSCHTLKNAHTTGDLGPNLDKLKPSFKLVATTVTLGKANPKTDEPMPAFSHAKGAQYAPFVLTAQQIADVAKYVSTVAGH
jgi:cytochrome c6